MKFNIRLLYLYLFSFVGLVITVIGSVRLMEIGLKTYVFKNADAIVSYPNARPIIPDGKPILEPSQEELNKYQKQETQRSRQREASGALSMIIIGLPLYLYHWKTIKKENRK